MEEEAEEGENEATADSSADKESSDVASVGTFEGKVK